MKIPVTLTIILSILSMGCMDLPTFTDSDANEVCEWDWKWETANSIGEQNRPPQGYTYAVITLYLKNNAGDSISTNPWNWKFSGAGIQYFPDEITYDDTIGHQTVELKRGMQLTTKMVFLVRDDVRTGQLKYNGMHPPQMVRNDSILEDSMATFD